MSNTLPLLLLIEDDPSILEVIQFALEVKGYRIIGVSSRDAGVTVLKEEPVGLILMDLHMPGMPPEEFLAECAKLRPEARIILMTAADRVLLKAQSLGINHWIGKPFELDTLVSILQECNCELESLKKTDGSLSTRCA